MPGSDKHSEGIKSGISCKEIDSLARDHIGNAGYGKYFDHGLGHSLGLEIHEDPRFSKVSTDFLKSNYVMTVEPGIYIPQEGFGIRLEDDVVIQPTGAPLNLMKNIPILADEIEDLMNP